MGKESKTVTSICYCWILPACMLTHVHIHACVFELHGCNINLCILVLVSGNSTVSTVLFQFFIVCSVIITFNVYTLFIFQYMHRGPHTFYNE